MSTSRLSATLLESAGLGVDRARSLAARALAASDADETEVRVAARAGEYTRFAGERIHQPQDIAELSVDVRCVVHGRGRSWAARAGTGVPGGVEAAVARAAAGARALMAAGSPGGAHHVAQPGPGGELADDLLMRPGTAAFDVAARVTAAARAMAAARLRGGRAAGMFGRALTELAVATSAGVDRYAAATEATGSLTVSVDGGSSHWADLDRDAERLELAAAIARTVAEAVRHRRPAPLPPGRYDVVLGPLATGELLEGFGAFGFTGTSAADGVGAVATRRGQVVAAPEMTVVDDPGAPRGLPFGFDGEGTATSTVTLLDAGAVTDAVTDLATAATLGTGSTGHAHIAREESPAPVAANLHLRPGTGDLAGLIGEVDRGVYVQRFWYTRVVDPAATTLTGVSRDGCFLIENGRLTRPLAGARFTESVFGVLARTDGIGSAVLSQPLMNVWNGSVTAPAIRVRGFRFGAPATESGTER